MSRVLVGLSGGVDSSTAALLLLQQGHDVAGISLRFHDNHDSSAAISVAAKLGISFYERDCRQDFHDSVLSLFLKQYAAGMTPNPCVICNENVKFKSLAIAAEESGYNAIATGHYARIIRNDTKTCLLRGKCGDKDQSYMLYRVPCGILSVTVFPLGDLSKADVRSIAARAELPNFSRESQDLCFAPEGCAEFLKRELAGEYASGDILDEDGNLIGRHRGLPFYTVGQKKGLGISSEKRYCVKLLDKQRNVIVLSRDGERRDSKIYACSCVWLNEPPVEGEKMSTRWRHPMRDVGVVVIKCSGDTVSVLPENETGWAAPGQSLVLYRRDIVVGGGFISYKE